LGRIEIFGAYCTAIKPNHPHAKRSNLLCSACAMRFHLDIAILACLTGLFIASTNATPVGLPETCCFSDSGTAPCGAGAASLVNPVSNGCRCFAPDAQSCSTLCCRELFLMVGVN
jgi:hypothetical protein